MPGVMIADSITTPSGRWDRRGLESVGFQGFVPFVGIDLALLPPRRGVYVILRESNERPTFLEGNLITRKPAYPVAKLEAKWIDGQTIVYIGKADPADGIYGRLGMFSKKSPSHTGAARFGSSATRMS